MMELPPNPPADMEVVCQHEEMDIHFQPKLSQIPEKNIIRQSDGSTMVEYPTSPEGWKSVCQSRWEDCLEIFKDDPFIKARDQPAEKAWEAFYHEQDANDSGLLTSKKTYTCTQRHVRKMVQDNSHVQDFRELYPIGCTKKYAVVCASVIASPESFHVFVMPIDSPEPPKTELVRRDRLPADRLNNYDMEKKLNENFQEASIENVHPVWDVLPMSRLESVPAISALDPVSGKFAIVCEGQENRIHVFDISKSSLDETCRLPPVRLGGNLVEIQPNLMAISSTCLAIAYCNALGVFENKDGSTSTDPLPPHVRVYRNNAWKVIITLKPKVKPNDEMRECYEISSIWFHRSHPDVLIVGTQCGGILVYNMAITEGSPQVTHPSGSTGIFYPGPDLTELYANYRKEAEAKSTSEENVETMMQALPEPARSPVWFVQWKDYKSAMEWDEKQYDTRLLVGLQNSLVVLNSSIHNVTEKAKDKLRIGKRPHAYIHRDTPALWMESLGGVLVVHDAATHEIILSDMASIRPCWHFNHPDVVGTMTPYVRPYPSIAIFSRRVVVLFPNGFVTFFEIASEEMQKDYAKEHERLLAEKMKNLSLKNTDQK